MAKKSEIEQLIARHGFNIVVDTDGNLTLEPSVLQLDNIDIHLVKRGMFKTDPALVPPELKDDNVFYIDEPPVVTATTSSGSIITIHLNTVSVHQETIEPEA